MWSNNTGDAKIERDQIDVHKILNGHGHENIDPYRTRLNASLVRKQRRLDVRKYFIPGGPSIEWNKLSANCVHFSLIHICLGP